MAGTRGTWNSRFGFIMAAVGSAVGLGNLVRFPREMAGQGGAAFLLVYLVLLLLVGLPAILGEMSLGKISNSSPVNAFKHLAKKAKVSEKWALLGIFGMLAAVFVLFFYTAIAGWALRFFVESFWAGWYNDPVGLFASVETGPWTIILNFLVVAVTVGIVAKGISGGIEKAAVIMMPALFAIVIGVAIFAGVKDIIAGGAGIKAVWQPEWGELKINHISKAVGQVFFSLSLGQGAMLTYASYMEKKQSVSEDGTIIAVADTGVALLAAMMVFPILGFTGLLTSTDPAIQDAIGGTFGTAFIAMPSAFVEMGGIGHFVGTVFFLGLFFAALSSAISLLEVPVSVLIDNLKLTRAKAAIIMGLVIYIPGVLSSISSTWLVLFDEIAVNFFIVIGVAATTAFAGWYVKDMAKELNQGVKFNVAKPLIWMMRTVTPVLIVVTFVFGGLWGVDADGGISFWHSAHAMCGEVECGGTSANWRELGHTVKLAFGGGH